LISIPQLDYRFTVLVGFKIWNPNIGLSIVVGVIDLPSKKSILLDWKNL
jgi:hypothetical protein